MWRHYTRRIVCWSFWLLALAVLLAVASRAGAQSPVSVVDDQLRGTYQRYGTTASPYHGGYVRQYQYGWGDQARSDAYGYHFRRLPFAGSPQAAHGSWFQRPYPYHLDYYRMRYGGSYEPYYSGGLYGTPQVVVPQVFPYTQGLTPY